MHELSLCETVIRIIERKSKAEKFSCVTRVTLELGALSGASEESLAFCFPLVAKGTIAEGAELVFTHTSDNALRVKELTVG